LRFDFSNKEEKISKDLILSYVSPLEIVEYYLNVKIKYNTLISSPFRKDSNPSFGIKEINNKIIAKDFSTGETFDCFSIVQKLYMCTFIEALKIISNDFNINKSNSKQLPRIQIDSSDVYNSKTTNNKKIITIRKQPFTKIDIDYWKQYSVNIEDLVKFNVFSCKQVFLDDKLVKYYTNNNPIYAYEFSEFDRISYKIYSPLADKKFKWLFNGSKENIEGYDMLSNLDTTLIITKSLKDVIVLYKLGYNAISLQGEANRLEYEFYNKLTKRFVNIISFYDTDEAGKRGADKLNKDFKIPSIFIPDEYDIKDISDFIKERGYQEAKEVIDKLVNGTIKP
jgi:hypothetical protein